MAPLQAPLVSQNIKCMPAVILRPANFLKFIFSKKATKMDEIFTVDLTLCSKCQIDGEDFVNFRGHLKNMNFVVNTL